jgi:putative FmdB family regulatory protein
MPIYEYQALRSDGGCEYCHGGFEVLQRINEKPLKMCPECGQPVKKIISWCRAAIVEKSQEHTSVKNKIKDYENSGMWSHAAELADKHSEKIKDKNLKVRALENYQKAGYDADSLSKHAKLDD